MGGFQLGTGLPALFWLLPCWSLPLLPHTPSSEAYRFPPTLTAAADLLALTLLWVAFVPTKLIASPSPCQSLLLHFF